MDQHGISESRKPNAAYTNQNCANRNMNDIQKTLHDMSGLEGADLGLRYQLEGRPGAAPFLEQL